MEPLDLLLERLSQGDAAAVEQIVTDVEPYLRRLVRRSLPAGDTTAPRVRFPAADALAGWSPADTLRCERPSSDQRSSRERQDRRGHRHD